MDIQEGILHRIEKQSGSHNVTLDPRPTCLPIDNHLRRLADDVLKIYGKQTNSYGTFSPDEDVYTFPTHFRSYLDSTVTLDLVGFSQTVLNLISATMQEALLATGGYVVFLKYTNQGREWFLIVMLKLKAGTGVDDATKSLTGAMTLDIEHLHEAARIDIDKWHSDEQPYLSFVKKKSGGVDVSRYFRLALGCTEYTDSQLNTKESMKAVDDYCAHKGWDAEQKRQARQKYYEYCSEKHAAGESINLESLSSRIDDQAPQAFRDYVREGEYSVNDTFSPHPRSYKRFKRLSAKIGNVSLAFDVDDLVAGNVVPDLNSHSITINNISSQLEERIKEALGNGSSD
ncbi:MAG: nucleoid-associated protein [Neptuniibacter sp.]